MLTRSLTLTAALLLAFAAAAREPVGFSIFPHSGVSEGSDIGGGHPRGIGFGYRFASPWAVEFTYQSLDADRDGRDVDVDTWRLDGIYHASQYRAVRPFFSLGLGGSSYDYARQAGAVQYTDEETHLSAGFGLNWDLNDRTSVRSDVRLYHGSDNVEISSTLALGIHHVFGEDTWTRGVTNDSDGDGVPNRRDRCPGTPSRAKVDSDGCPLDEDGDGVPDYRDRCPESTDITRAIDARGCYGQGPLLNTRFAFDSFAATKVNETQVRRFAQYLQQYLDEAVVLEGHTDSRGDVDYNQRLSERRAETIADLLITKFGIDARRVSTKGFGESRPAASNANDAGRAENRRVESDIQGK